MECVANIFMNQMKKFEPENKPILSKIDRKIDKKITNFETIFWIFCLFSEFGPKELGQDRPKRVGLNVGPTFSFLRILAQTRPNILVWADAPGPGIMDSPLFICRNSGGREEEGES
jgi:hypothetical protein